MGRKLFMSFLSPDLSIGVMFAFFHSEGNCRECNLFLCTYSLLHPDDFHTLSFQVRPPVVSQVNRNVHQYTTTVTASVPPVLDISWNVNLTILNGVIKPSLTYTETYRSRGRIDSSSLFINSWALMWQNGPHVASFDEDSMGEGMDGGR